MHIFGLNSGVCCLSTFCEDRQFFFFLKTRFMSVKIGMTKKYTDVKMMMLVDY